MNWPRKGHYLCAQRHGKAPQVIAKAKANVERAEAERRMAKALTSITPQPIFSDPLQGLLWEVAMSAQAVEWLAEQVAQLTVPDPQQSGIPDTVEAILNDDDEERRTRWRDKLGRPIIYQDPTTLWGADHDGDGAVHVLVKMWNEERDRHVKNCSVAIKAGVSERMVALAEQQGTLVVRIVSHVLDNLGIDEPARIRGRKLAAAEMRRLSAQMTPLDAASRPA